MDDKEYRKYVKQGFVWGLLDAVNEGLMTRKQARKMAKEIHGIKHKKFKKLEKAYVPEEDLDCAVETDEPKDMPDALTKG